VTYVRSRISFFFISDMHHEECTAPNVAISLQGRRFWDMSIASFMDRFMNFRSCWIVFIQLVRGRPGGLLQFSKWKAIKIFLASVSSGICSVAEQGEMPCLDNSRKVWLPSCLSHLVIPHMVASFDSQQLSQTQQDHYNYTKSHVPTSSATLDHTDTTFVTTVFDCNAPSPPSRDISRPICLWLHIPVRLCRPFNYHIHTALLGFILICV